MTDSMELPTMLPWLETVLPVGTLETWTRVAERAGRRRTIPAGKVIQRAGHRMHKMLYIHSGEVRLASKHGEKLQWMLVLSRGHLLSDETIFSHRPALYEAVVTQAADVTSFSEAEIRSLLHTCPDLAVELMRSLTSKLEIRLQQVSALSFYNASERIHTLSEFMAQTGLSFQSSNLTHRDVADIVGCCRVTASKVLSALER